MIGKAGNVIDSLMTHTQAGSRFEVLGFGSIEVAFIVILGLKTKGIIILSAVLLIGFWFLVVFGIQ